MGFVRVAENHRRAKAARERAEAEAAAREARRIPVLTCQTKPPESVRLLDRIYRPVVEKQLKRRAARQEQEKMVPEQLRQWRWARLNPGLDHITVWGNTAGPGARTVTHQRRWEAPAALPGDIARLAVATQRMP